MTTNSDLISRVQASTGARLIGWQFAADGRWETAGRIFLDGGPQQPAPVRVEQWLADQTTDDVAFEALFESTERERLFLGARLTQLDRRKQANVLSRLIASGRRDEGVGDVLRNLRNALGDQDLATGRPDYLELGVFDLWNRVKPLVVWRTGETLGTRSAMILPDEIPGKTDEPDAGFAPLHAPQPNPLMLEAVWKRDVGAGCNFQCWIGLPVSEYGNAADRFSLSESRYLSAASTFIERA